MESDPNNLTETLSEEVIMPLGSNTALLWEKSKVLLEKNILLVTKDAYDTFVKNEDMSTFKELQLKHAEIIQMFRYEIYKLAFLFGSKHQKRNNQQYNLQYIIFKSDESNNELDTKCLHFIGENTTWNDDQDKQNNIEQRLTLLRIIDEFTMDDENYKIFYIDPENYKMIRKDAQKDNIMLDEYNTIVNKLIDKIKNTYDIIQFQGEIETKDNINTVKYVKKLDEINFPHQLPIEVFSLLELQKGNPYASQLHLIKLLFIMAEETISDDEEETLLRYLLNLIKETTFTDKQYILDEKKEDEIKTQILMMNLSEHIKKAKIIEESKVAYVNADLLRVDLMEVIDKIESQVSKQYLRLIEYIDANFDKVPVSQQTIYLEIKDKMCQELNKFFDDLSVMNFKSNNKSFQRLIQEPLLPNTMEPKSLNNICELIKIEMKNMFHPANKTIKERFIYGKDVSKLEAIRDAMVSIYNTQNISMREHILSDLVQTQIEEFSKKLSMRFLSLYENLSSSLRVYMRINTSAPPGLTIPYYHKISKMLENTPINKNRRSCQTIAECSVAPSKGDDGYSYVFRKQNNYEPVFVRTLATLNSTLQSEAQYTECYNKKGFLFDIQATVMVYFNPDGFSLNGQNVGQYKIPVDDKLLQILKHYYGINKITDLKPTAVSKIPFIFSLQESGDGGEFVPCESSIYSPNEQSKGFYFNLAPQITVGEYTLRVGKWTGHSFPLGAMQALEAEQQGMKKNLYGPFHEVYESVNRHLDVGYDANKELYYGNCCFLSKFDKELSAADEMTMKNTQRGGGKVISSPVHQRELTQHPIWKYFQKIKFDNKPLKNQNNNDKPENLFDETNELELTVKNDNVSQTIYLVYKDAIDSSRRNIQEPSLNTDYFCHNILQKQKQENSSQEQKNIFILCPLIIKDDKGNVVNYTNYGENVTVRILTFFESDCVESEIDNCENPYYRRLFQKATYIYVFKINIGALRGHTLVFKSLGNTFRNSEVIDQDHSLMYGQFCASTTNPINNTDHDTFEKAEQSLFAEIVTKGSKSMGMINFINKIYAGMEKYFFQIKLNNNPKENMNNVGYYQINQGLNDLVDLMMNNASGFTIFGYGYSGTGKSYTLFGKSNENLYEKVRQMFDQYVKNMTLLTIDSPQNTTVEFAVNLLKAKLFSKDGVKYYIFPRENGLFSPLICENIKANNEEVLKDYYRGQFNLFDIFSATDRGDDDNILPENKLKIKDQIIEFDKQTVQSYFNKYMNVEVENYPIDIKKMVIVLNIIHFQLIPDYYQSYVDNLNSPVYEVFCFLLFLGLGEYQIKDCQGFIDTLESKLVFDQFANPEETVKDGFLKFLNGQKQKIAIKPINNTHTITSSNESFNNKIKEFIDNNVGTGEDKNTQTILINGEENNIKYSVLLNENKFESLSFFVALLKLFVPSSPNIINGFYFFVNNPTEIMNIISQNNKLYSTGFYRLLDFWTQPIYVWENVSVTSGIRDQMKYIFLCALNNTDQQLWVDNNESEGKKTVTLTLIGKTFAFEFNNLLLTLRQSFEYHFFHNFKQIDNLYLTANNVISIKNEMQLVDFKDMLILIKNMAEAIFTYAKTSNGNKSDILSQINDANHEYFVEHYINNKNFLWALSTNVEDKSTYYDAYQIIVLNNESDKIAKYQQLTDKLYRLYILRTPGQQSNTFSYIKKWQIDDNVNVMDEKATTMSKSELIKLATNSREILSYSFEFDSMLQPRKELFFTVKDNNENPTYGFTQLAIRDLLENNFNVKIHKVLDLYGKRNITTPIQLENGEIIEYVFDSHIDNNSCDIIDTLANDSDIKRVNIAGDMELDLINKIKTGFSFENISNKNKKDAEIRLFYDIIEKIEKKRIEIGSMKPTPNNLTSSRAHLFIIFEITAGSTAKSKFQQWNSSKNEEIKSYMTIIDMAGIENPIDIAQKVNSFKKNDSLTNKKDSLFNWINGGRPALQRNAFNLNEEASTVQNENRLITNMSNLMHYSNIHNEQLIHKLKFEVFLKNKILSQMETDLNSFANRVKILTREYNDCIVMNRDKTVVLDDNISQTLIPYFWAIYYNLILYRYIESVLEIAKTVLSDSNISDVQKWEAIWLPLAKVRSAPMGLQYEPLLKILRQFSIDPPNINEAPLIKLINTLKSSEKPNTTLTETMITRFVKSYVFTKNPFYKTMNDNIQIGHNPILQSRNAAATSLQRSMMNIVEIPGSEKKVIYVNMNSAIAKENPTKFNLNVLTFTVNNTPLSINMSYLFHTTTGIVPPLGNVVTNLNINHVGGDLRAAVPMFIKVKNATDSVFTDDYTVDQLYFLYKNDFDLLRNNHDQITELQNAVQNGNFEQNMHDVINSIGLQNLNETKIKNQSKYYRCDNFFEEFSGVNYLQLLSMGYPLNDWLTQYASDQKNQLNFSNLLTLGSSKSILALIDKPLEKEDNENYMKLFDRDINDNDTIFETLLDKKSNLHKYFNYYKEHSVLYDYNEKLHLYYLKQNPSSIQSELNQLMELQKWSLIAMIEQIINEGFFINETITHIVEYFKHSAKGLPQTAEMSTEKILNNSPEHYYEQNKMQIDQHYVLNDITAEYVPNKFEHFQLFQEVFTDIDTAERDRNLKILKKHLFKLYYETFLGKIIRSQDEVGDGFREIFDAIESIGSAEDDEEKEEEEDLHNKIMTKIRNTLDNDIDPVNMIALTLFYADFIHNSSKPLQTKDEILNLVNEIAIEVENKSGNIDYARYDINLYPNFWGTANGESLLNNEVCLTNKKTEQNNAICVLGCDDEALKIQLSKNTNTVKIIALLQYLKNLTKGNSKYVMMCLIRPEIKAQYCEGARKGLLFAQEVSSTIIRDKSANININEMESENTERYITFAQTISATENSPTERINQFRSFVKSKKTGGGRRTNALKSKKNKRH